MSSVPPAPVATDFSALARLRASARDQDPEATREAARQFESLFTQMLLKSMRAVSFGDDLTGDQGGFYRDMLDQQMALHLSAGKGLGLADLMIRQLQGAATRTPTAPAAGADIKAMATPVRQGAGAPGAPGAPGVQAAGWQPATPEAFVADLWPHAQKAARELGVSPRVLVAQAALETGWGRHMMRHPDGSPSYNLFGIKAGPGWEGGRVSHMTLEFREGLPQRERAEFRAYPGLAESFDDYVAFVGAQPRYETALRHGHDESGFARGLQAAGYATDPHYADKIRRIAQGRELSAAPARTPGRVAWS